MSQLYGQPAHSDQVSLSLLQKWLPLSLSFPLLGFSHLR